MAKACKRPRAFTLLEVILAVSLTGVVLMLLTTALHLLLHRVETSRWRVESSQLARGILNQIATDLRAARYYAPSDFVRSNSSSDAESEDGDSASGDSLLVLGIYGSEKELRIDRAAVWQWQRLARDEEVEETEDSTADDMPQTVRYFLSEGDPVKTDAFAAEGVLDEESLPDYAGLSRQRLATAAWVTQSETELPETTSGITEGAELIAPEVLDLEFAYFDGEELVDEWDSAEQGGLPQAVEVTLKVAKETLTNLSKRPPDDPEELEPDLEDALEYRILVRLPRTRPRTDVPGPRRVEP